jgi:hypothetical protein
MKTCPLLICSLIFASKLLVKSIKIYDGGAAWGLFAEVGSAGDSLPNFVWVK